MSALSALSVPSFHRLLCTFEAQVAQLLSAYDAQSSGELEHRLDLREFAALVTDLELDLAATRIQVRSSARPRRLLLPSLPQPTTPLCLTVSTAPHR